MIRHRQGFIETTRGTWGIADSRLCHKAQYYWMKIDTSDTMKPLQLGEGWNHGKHLISWFNHSLPDFNFSVAYISSQNISWTFIRTPVGKYI